MDPFRQLRSGETIPGLPSQAWNRMLESLKTDMGGGETGTPVGDAIQVVTENTTASPVDRFGILGIEGPVVRFDQNPTLFYDQDAVRGIAPSAGRRFVVVQRPVSVNGFAPARILGFTRVRVDVLDSADNFCDCTDSTDHLTSASSGPARILWVESDGEGGSGSGGRTTGTQWAVVLLTGGDSGCCVEIGEPNEASGSGSGGPAGLLDWRIVEIGIDPPSATAGEDVWVIDANSL